MRVITVFITYAALRKSETIEATLMNEQIKHIAMRLQGLREALEVSIEDVATTCGISTQQYKLYESGTSDIPISILHTISSTYKIELTALLTGDEPHVNSYTITRKNKGVQTERRKAYHYEALATSFKNKKGEPFIVTAPIKTEQTPLNFNAHNGQEFNLVIEGRLELHLDSKIIVLNTGDSIYFDSSQKHAMRALENKPCKFLAFIS